jgi:hypothetical protein
MTGPPPFAEAACPRQGRSGASRDIAAAAGGVSFKEDQDQHQDQTQSFRH